MQAVNTRLNGIFRFKAHYAFWALLIFITEILIALFAHDRFIRPYVGDFLVVMLIYCFIKAFINIPVVPAALAALLFSYFVETLQYFNIVERLGLQDSGLAKTVIGSSFEWTDLFAYTLGILFVLYAEKLVAKKAGKGSAVEAS